MAAPLGVDSYLAMEMSSFESRLSEKIPHLSFGSPESVTANLREAIEVGVM